MIRLIYESLLQVLFLVPFIIPGIRNNKNIKIGILLLAFLLFIVTSVSTDFFANVSIFEGQKWNWVGKAVSLFIALVFIYAYKPITPSQFGMTVKIETIKTTPIFLVCTGYFVLRLILYLTITKHTESFHIETILFQFIMAGTAEEIIFRGALLTLLNQVFLKPKWTLINVSFGWSAIITSLLFGFTHGILLDSNYHFHVNFPAILRTAFDGFLFALLAEKTKSLLPGILFHNALNLIGNH